ELDDDLEDFSRRRFEAQQIDEKNQVPRGRYGNELGQSLDDAKYGRLQEDDEVHAAGFRCPSATCASPEAARKPSRVSRDIRKSSAWTWVFVAALAGRVRFAAADHPHAIACNQRSIRLYVLV